MSPSRQTLSATVVSVDPLTHTVWSYRLQPEHWVSYHSGQYLQINPGNNDGFFSIANASEDASTYELHVRLPRDPQKQRQLQKELALNQRINICLPFGRCDISVLNHEKPILFIAAGTGFAPIRSIIQEYLARPKRPGFELYWSVHQEEDFYLLEEINHWQSTMPAFHFYPHLTQSAHRSLISEILARYGKDIIHFQIVMAGPFELRYMIRDALVQAGLSREDIFSDAFEFE